jgi:hypothetical protein
MLRYRIERDENGRYFVLPAVAWIVSLEETYATRAAAQETAKWFNRRRADVPPVIACQVRMG